ncbi:hypothetical protein DOTSEDRAFT_33524 [Dothistroma septosporum NZE10]|uniref:Uncharacterized protein n=1 Tax=Dothistroma septosporum (strain NZE10 / CBS 128990) TaxID=675120 RepID=N1PNC5_DOTSN|nr:hypothetical protein DOTSEDRAFT_33524 [Dothistroma septosporum NZE10]
MVDVQFKKIKQLQAEVQVANDHLTAQLADKDEDHKKAEEALRNKYEAQCAKLEDELGVLRKEIREKKALKASPDVRPSRLQQQLGTEQQSVGQLRRELYAEKTTLAATSGVKEQALDEVRKLRGKLEESAGDCRGPKKQKSALKAKISKLQQGMSAGDVVKDILPMRY